MSTTRLNRRRPRPLVAALVATGLVATSPAPAQVMLQYFESRWETIERARDIYGVVLSGSAENDDLAIDVAATEAARANA